MDKFQKQGNSNSSNTVIPRMQILSSPVISKSILRKSHPFLEILGRILDLRLLSITNHIYSKLCCCQNKLYLHANLHGANVYTRKFIKCTTQQYEVHNYRERKYQ
jgi:hypothetical protein